MRRNRRNGFTLVELMVSILLVLVLMLGVNQVFKTVTGTLSAGSAISDNTRQFRAVQTVMERDFAQMVTGTDAPFLIINSEQIPAFRNRPDELSDLDYSSTATPAIRAAAMLTVDVDGDNVEGGVPGETISPATIGPRNHRADSIVFFARGLFKRASGNPGQNFISPMTRNEAFIKYSHLRIWDGVGSLTASGSFIDPGTGTFGNNRNNFYASDWVYGRNAIMLSEGQDTLTGNGSFTDVIPDESSPPVNQRFYRRATGLTGTSLSPLRSNSQPDGGGPTIQETFTDLAGVTIADMRQIMDAYFANGGNVGTWGGVFTYRLAGNPFVPRPMTIQGLNQTAPCLLAGARSVTIEWAGDYIAQDNDPASATYGNTTGWYGAATSPTTDSELDYVLVGVPGNFRREIRWYGFPRDPRQAGTIAGNQPAASAAQTMPAVVPLRDVLRTAPGNAASVGAVFEKQIPALKLNYSATPGGVANGETYQCAWTGRDQMPKMLRMVITLDDPQNRLQGSDGQTAEFVFELP